MPRAILALALALPSLFLAASPALGCSPPFEASLRKLGPDQIVVVGTIGQRVENGRLFHVERWFNGGNPTATIVIAFQEGEPVGDCSYPVSAGQRLIIAPRMDHGRLMADLATLQAEPDSAEGRLYLHEAQDLYGPGEVPEPEGSPASDVSEHVSGPSVTGVEPSIALLVVLAIACVFGIFLRAHRQRSTS